MRSRLCHGTAGGEALPGLVAGVSELEAQPEILKSSSGFVHRRLTGSAIDRAEWGRQNGYALGSGREVSCLGQIQKRRMLWA
jgi:hypothetical protein